MDYMNQIHRLCRQEDIQKELDDYNRPVQNDRSIDDCLDTTSAFVQWAQKKAPQYDPENRRPLPNPNDSPLSDYDIEFTRLNKTDQGLSTLSSLNIPMASNTSLSVLSNGTPRENALNRRSSNIPRRIGSITPSLFIRHKQSLNIGLPGRQSQNPRGSGGDTFEPLSSSTPIRAQRKKPSIFENLAGGEESQNKLVDSSSNSQTPVQHQSMTNNHMNTSTPKGRTYQKVSQASQVNESELTLVPTAKPPNESVIPETQDDRISEDEDDRISEDGDGPLPQTERSANVSNVRTPGAYDTHTINRNTLTPKDRTYRKMTQGSQIDGSDLALVPETQPPNESVIPETQDDPIPETQEEQLPNTERNNSIVTTPTRSQRKKSSMYANNTGGDASPNKLRDSPMKSRTSIRHDTHTINGNTLSPKSRTYQLSSPTNRIDNRTRSILVPETQPPNESVIPETQDEPIPETQEERLQETEQNDSVSNARASDKRDTLTNDRNASIPINKPKRNPVVLLSPLSEEIKQKYNMEQSTVPMDLVFTPPRNFQNSRRTSQLENDDLIVEASPSTCAFRKKQLEQHIFDQPDADQSSQSTSNIGTPVVQRKRGRRKSENPELTKLQNISTHSNRHSLQANSKGRRLASLDALRNDTEDDNGTDIEQDIVASPVTSTSDQTKSTADENVFKVPEIPRKKSIRKSKQNQTNDSIANGNADENASPDEKVNEIASTSASRRVSHDSFDFSVHIEPMNDDEIQPYMPHNDTTPPDPPKSSAKNKGQKTKASAKAVSKTKPKPAQKTVDTDDVPTRPRRRPSRDSPRDKFLAEYLGMISLPANRALNQKSKSKERRTEMGPPKKKLRTDPEIQRVIPKPPLKASSKSMISSKTRPTVNQSSSASTSSTTAKSKSSKASVSSKSKSKTDQSSSAPVSSSSKPALSEWVAGMDEKELMATEFWKDIMDYEKDNDIQTEDILYIKTEHGVIEAATHKQIDYVEIDDVKYGFVASTDKRHGLMRFKPGAKKEYEKSCGVIYLFVLQGCFEVRGEDGKLQLGAASQTVIEKGVFYEITNKGKKTGIIQFEYTE